MRMKQLTFFFRVGSGVTTNFRISHHCFLCVCCPTLWMPTFLAQLQEDLRLANARSIPRMPMPTRMTRSEDPKIFEVANDVSVRWRFANKKNKVIVKLRSTFDLEGAHHLKNIRIKNTSRESQGGFLGSKMSTQTRHKFEVKRGKGSTSPNESTSSSSPSLKIWHRKSTLGSLSRLQYVS